MSQIVIEIDENNNNQNSEDIFGLHSQEFDNSGERILSYRLGDMNTHMILGELTNGDKVLRMSYKQKDSFCLNFSNDESLQNFAEAVNVLLNHKQKEDDN